MRFELVLMAAWLTVVVAAAPPARHLPVWSAVLDINSFTVWATMSNDNAIFAVVNNTVTSYNPGTGKLIWTSAISSVDILIVPAVNNKWLVVLTGTDIFVLAANNGSIVSHTQNFTSATSLVPTQDEDMFIAIDDSVGCHVVQVTRHGLQRVWASNQSLVSVGIVPGTPYMYLYTDTSFLYVMCFHTWSEFVLSGVVAVSPTPVGKRLAAVVGANVTMIERTCCTSGVEQRTEQHT